MFDWKWYLKDLKQDKDIKVFSTFSCGGGSTMGYKRAGFQVLGNVEIDPAMNELYVQNNHPQYNFLMDLREFNKKKDLPEELYHLDILDGSPPCSTFSMAGEREDSWGKKKKFREGQELQTLDDLFFVFLETVEKLKPKVAIAENVTGLLKGNAKGYVNEIIKRFHKLGYDVQLFCFNAQYMDVPQRRERVFFIVNNQKFPKLKMEFHGKPITFGEVRSEKGLYKDTERKKIADQYYRLGDKSIEDINKRIGKTGGYTERFLYDCKIACTLTASGNGLIRACDLLYLTRDDIVNISSFPQDYDFLNQRPVYVCGMCVPPNMMANIATEVYKQWFEKK